MIRKYFLAIDDRLQTASFARKALRKAFPDNWSFLIGELALYCFVTLIATGLFLTMFFQADPTVVIYEGSYLPLRGKEMSQAYASVLNLSFDVDGGLLMRQIHHWAALAFIAAISVHAGRVFFTGTFRKPRDLNWLIGWTLLVLALAEGFTGYSLPDDLISGVGLRIAYSVLLSIPVISAWACFLIFGGEVPTDDTVPRFLIFHIMLLPGLVLAFVGAHLGLMWRQKHTNFAGKGRKEYNVVGSQFFPNMVMKMTGLMAAVFGILALTGAIFQINPIWLYGPYDPAQVAQPSQPDWYIGWLEGALRLFPDWSIVIGGYTFPNVFFPGIVLSGVFFGIMFMWPTIERKITKDEGIHHILDRPRDVPWRTAVGVAAFTFMFVLTLAGSNDVLAKYFGVNVDSLTIFLRYIVVLGPILAGIIAWRICLGLQRSELHPAYPRRRTRFVRTESGGIETEEVPAEVRMGDEPDIGAEPPAEIKS